MAHHVRVQLDARNRDVIDPLPTQIAAASTTTSTSPTHRPFVPLIERVRTSSARPFMPYSTCSTADCLHPPFAELSERCARRPQLHRELWSTSSSSTISPNVGCRPRQPWARLRGGFRTTARSVRRCGGDDRRHRGTRRDRTPRGVAGDQPVALGAETLSNPGICDAGFSDLVSYRTVDMNAVPNDLSGFDFCWSACCFEHLGSLRRAAEFVIESVEAVSRPAASPFTPPSSTCRRTPRRSDRLDCRSIDTTISPLSSPSSNSVAPLTIAPDAHVLDHFVDLPPDHGDLYPKLELAGYATTSVGLVITKAGERA